MKQAFLLLFVFVVALRFYSCTEDNHSLKPRPVTLDVNSLSQQSPLVALGRTLFYDTHLSINNSISCATCHKQIYAFSDNEPFSRGFENRLTKRNSIAIQNLSNQMGFISSNPLFWDGRDSILSTMVLRPILNHVEMGMNDLDQLVERVRNQSYYSELFHNAFDDGNITSERIASSLTFFLNEIISMNTALDLCNGTIENCLSNSAARGKVLFSTIYNCESCHNTAISGGYSLTEASFRNIGLDENYTDNGRGEITHNSNDNGKFKVPSLRNIAFTAPYMHDGRFNTLEDVLEHYSHGISNHPNLDPVLKTNTDSPIRMNIPDQDKIDLIAFLNALTDVKIITNPELSNPFVLHH